jgi:DNA-binding MarR family transcriptional regulator
MLSPSWDFFTEIKEPCVKPQYSESFRLIERMHRQFLEVVKSELDRLGIQDINSVQGLILYNIGDEELTVGELTTRGYYLGSNVSYNVRKMVENGYLMQHRSTHDRRSIRVKLSPRGLDLYQKMDQLFDRHAASLNQNASFKDELANANAIFRQLERFWGSMVTFSPSDELIDLDIPE